MLLFHPSPSSAFPKKKCIWKLWVGTLDPMFMNLNLFSLVWTDWGKETSDMSGIHSSRLVLLSCLLAAGTSSSSEGVRQVSVLHWETFGHAAHQRAEDPAADLGAVAAQPQAAGPSLVTHGGATAPRLQGPTHPGRGPQLQGQGDWLTMLAAVIMADRPAHITGNYGKHGFFFPVVDGTEHGA